MQFLDFAAFERNALDNPGQHWHDYKDRWKYYSRAVEIAQTLDINNPSDVLEMGTMGVSIVPNCMSIDYDKAWNFKNKKPTYIHDARAIPWPIATKKFKLFVALRVFQHLAPKQKECFLEAKRIAENVLIVVPNEYKDELVLTLTSSRTGTTASRPRSWRTSRTVNLLIFLEVRPIKSASHEDLGYPRSQPILLAPAIGLADALPHWRYRCHAAPPWRYPVRADEKGPPPPPPQRASPQCRGETPSPARADPAPPAQGARCQPGTCSPIRGSFVNRRASGCGRRPRPGCGAVGAASVSVVKTAEARRPGVCPLAPILSRIWLLPCPFRCQQSPCCSIRAKIGAAYQLVSPGAGSPVEQHIRRAQQSPKIRPIYVSRYASIAASAARCRLALSSGSCAPWL